MTGIVTLWTTTYVCVHDCIIVSSDVLLVLCPCSLSHSLSFSLSPSLSPPSLSLLLPFPPPPFPPSLPLPPLTPLTQSDISGVDEEEAMAELEAEGGADSEGEHADYCHTCKDGGELLCCDFCPLAYHLGCLTPPMECIPDGDWKCPRCEAKKLPGKVEKLLTWHWKDVSASKNKKTDDGTSSELEDDVR